MKVTQMNDVQLSWAFGVAGGYDESVIKNSNIFNPLIDNNILKPFWSYPECSCKQFNPKKERTPSSAIGTCPEPFGYLASIGTHHAFGLTPAQAICRVVVYKEFGQDVDLPDELMESETDDDQ